MYMTSVSAKPLIAIFSITRVRRDASASRWTPIFMRSSRFPTTSYPRSYGSVGRDCQVPN